MPHIQARPVLLAVLFPTLIAIFGLMSDMFPANFKCPNCGAEYEMVRAEAPPGPTTDREITCLNCGGPLPGREGGFLLKYFLVSRLRRGVVAQSSRKVLKL
jgi:DNA-directed RNA polymerase subunit RPC12/RpoP